MIANSPYHSNIDELKNFIDMASGRLEADICIQNAKIVNVFTNEIYINKDVLIGNGKILGIVDTKSAKAKHYYDAKNAFLLPGFIDAHVHIESSMLMPTNFAALALENGTTTLIADPHEIANVLGLAGIKYMIDSLKDMPINAYFMLPSCVPATPFENTGATLNSKDLEALISYDNILGLGEMMNYPGVLYNDPQVLEKIMLAHKNAMIIDGHAPMMQGRELDAYIGSGISTDHECSTYEEMKDRIERGQYVFLRLGSSAKDAIKLMKYVNEHNAHLCCFCCDDISAKDILEHGHMQRHLRLAIQEGLDALTAIRMLTLYPAKCYGLKNVGALAPGYRADCVLVDNLEEFNVLDVFSQGIKIDKNQSKMANNNEITKLEKAIHIAPYTLKDFKFKASGLCKVIGINPNSLVTSSLHIDIISDEEGYFDYSKNPNIHKIAVFERHKATGNIGLGLVKGYIAENAIFDGAIASSVSHDSHNIIVIGDNDEDMYLAVKTLEEQGGGIVLIKNGEIVEKLALPIAGLMSNEEASIVSEKKTRLLNFPYNKEIDPHILLSFLALSVIPELKITDQGLFDVLQFKFTSINVE